MVVLRLGDGQIYTCNETAAVLLAVVITVAEVLADQGFRDLNENEVNAQIDKMRNGIDAEVEGADIFELRCCFSGKILLGPLGWVR